MGAYDEVIALEPGPHTITVVARDGTGRTSVPVSRTFTVRTTPAVSPRLLFTPDLSILRDLQRNAAVQSANKTIAAPTLTAVAIVNTAVAVGSAGVNATILLHYLASLFTEPFLLLTRKRRKPWGIVYHALSKRPVDLALVRVLDAVSGKIHASRVTDRDGRFAFLVEPGSYRLAVTHPRFAFPSTYLTGKRSDTAYDNLYHGDSFALEKKADAITANIPLDPKEEIQKDAVRTRGPRRGHAAVAYVGPLLALGSFGISPTIPLGALLLVHLGTLLLFRRIARPRKPKTTGVVQDAATHQPVPHARRRSPLRDDVPKAR